MEPETCKRASDIFERAIDLDTNDRREWIRNNATATLMSRPPYSSCLMRTKALNH
jgi:hypothetical protein